LPHNLAKRSIKGFAWAASESIGVAAISFVTFVILARLLEPQDFGVVALATVFVFFCNLLTGHTFADAIVQRRDLDPSHLDTAFWSTLGVALVLMAGCLAAADLAADLLGEPGLADVLKWLSLVIPLSAVSSVQLALFRRDMRFDAIARRTLAGRGLGAGVGIAMAVAGYGIWSLVAQQLVGQLATTIALMIGPWRPRWRFSQARFREMWGFGFYVSSAQIVTGAGEQALILVIGALFGSTTLGYFAVAWRTVQLIKSLVSSAVYHVGLSAFSRLQHDTVAVSGAFLKATRISCLAGFPVAIGIALVAEPFILAAFDAKWHASVPLLSVLALELVAASYGMFLSALYRAMNRPGWSLAMSLVYTLAGLAGVLAAAPYGIQAVVAVWVGRALLLMPFHVVLVARLLSRPVAWVSGPAVAPLVAAACMAAGVALVHLALPRDLPPLAVLCILGSMGSAIYVAAIRLLFPGLADLALRAVSMAASPSGKPS